MYRSSSVNMNPVRGDREDEKRMLPCRYFVAGFCHRGSRCKFFHPNMHGRDPVIRVPDLPSDFTLVPQYNPYEGSQASPGISSVLDMSPCSRGLRPNRRMKTTIASPINSSPPRRPQIRDSYRDFMSPSSNAYAEYMTYTQYNRESQHQEEDAAMDDFSDSADESKPPAQNTVFNHINWSDFLAPGVRPPPPTNVPDQATAIISPARVLNELKAEYARFSPMSTLSTRSYNKDMPPEGSLSQDDEADLLEIIELLDGKPKKLSAKEELQMKVKQIAKELADEPVSQARSLDSFFQDGKASDTSSGTASSPASASCLVDSMKGAAEGAEAAATKDEEFNEEVSKNEENPETDAVPEALC